MKTYYQLLGLTPQASTNDIKNTAKMHIKNISNSNLYTSSKKKTKIQEIENAYKILSDYHKRREYDDTIVLQPININNFQKNYTPFGISSFNISDSFTQNMDISKNSYQSYSSFSQGIMPLHHRHLK